MKSEVLIITNDTGLHSRPADLFVRTAKLFNSKITINKDSKTVDAKHIVKVILLNVTQGSNIEIQADGDDENIAIELLSRLIKSDFQYREPLFIKRKSDKIEI